MEKIADVSAKEITRVKYNGDKNLLIYKSIEEKEVYKEVRFEAKDGNNSIIFDIHRPGSSMTNIVENKFKIYRQ